MRSERGITLIAMALTVIILAMLAAITLNASFNSGTEAKKSSENMVNKVNGLLEEYDGKINNVTNNMNKELDSIKDN